MNVAHDAEDTYAVTNNHNLGKATVNALELRAFLTGALVPVPPLLLEHYPELKDVARATTGALQKHG
jgi:hypothetical protein